MNATSLYVSACRVMLSSDGELADLFRLLPYLRAALSCAVCGRLVRRAASPSPAAAAARCPHAVCRGCRAGRKRLKPACMACRDLHRYKDNRTLRILLQSYKRLCDYFSGTEVFRRLAERPEPAAAGLVDLIREGADFSDGYESTAGLSKSAYSILPCVYTNSSTQTQSATSSSASSAEAPIKSEPPSPPPESSTDGASVYSVTYAGTGNKITIKRKPPEEEEKPATPESASSKDNGSNQSSFKKPTYRSRNSGNKRKGCRCGNATATPGKLTCCGQRCPCYVESKACSECKCKGCRNPHRADGLKVRPHIPQLENLHISTSIKQEHSPSGSGSMESLDTDTYEIGPIDSTISFDPPDIKPSDIKVYATNFQEISLESFARDLPTTIMMDEDVSPSSQVSDDDSSSPRLQDSQDPSSPLSSSNHGTMLSVHNLFSPYGNSSSLSHQDNTSDVEVDV